MTAPRLRLLVAVLLAAAVIGVYGPVAGLDFVSIDDNEYVYENEHVCRGLSWEHVVWAFTTPVAGNWHPLTMLTHMADCQCFGVGPKAQHLSNLLFHLANTLLLFGVLLKLTDRPAAVLPSRSPVWSCALVAALFALHPLHVESVAWVSERKDVLSVLFFLLTLLTYEKYVSSLEARMPTTSHGPGSTTPTSSPSAPPAHPASLLTHHISLSPFLWYTLSLLSFALGLLSKPMLVTLPFVLLLLDYWPLSRFAPLTYHASRITLRHLLLEKLPFFALTLLFSVLTFVVQRNSGAVVGFEGFPLRPRLAHAMVAYARYLGKTVWPDALALPYPYEQWPAEVVGSATALFIILSLLVFVVARRRKCWFVGWFWFAGMLVPVIGIVQAGIAGHGRPLYLLAAHRPLYCPRLGGRAPSPTDPAPPSRRRSRRRAHRAVLLSARHDPPNALAHFQACVRLAPDWPLALNNLAWALATQPAAHLRNGAEATGLALHAVSLTQHQSPGTLDTLAAAYAEADRFAEAVATAQAAL